MKKLFFGLIVLFLFVLPVYGASITTIRFTTDADVTSPNLDSNVVTLTDAINSFDGTRIQVGTVSADALTDSANPEKRWDEVFNDFVFTGLLPPTSASLTSTTTLGTAYVDGVRVVKDATAKTYTASKHTYVDLSSSGTYTYQEVAILAAEPSTTANSIRLARVSTDATTVQIVRDDRVTAISLVSNEDFYRNGFTIKVATPDAVNVSPGALKHGTTFVRKTISSDLNIGTAGDWASGSSERGTDTAGYVVISSAGVVKLTTTLPNVSDTSNNTTQRLRYNTIDGTVYRYLNWFYMNATGSGNIEDWGYSELSDLGTVNTVTRTYRDAQTGTDLIPNDDTIPQTSEGDELMTIVFVPTDADSMLRVEVIFEASASGTAPRIAAVLFRDSGSETEGVQYQAVSPNEAANIILRRNITADAIIATTFKVNIGASQSGTLIFNGEAGSREYGGTMSSTITVTEIPKD